MEDLKKAGLNPALTATGGSGASASGGGSYASGGGGDIFGALNAMVGMANQTKMTNADTKYKKDLGEAALMQAMATAKQAGISEQEFITGWAGKILGGEAGKDVTSAINAPLKHIKKKWKEAKITKKRKGEKNEEYQKRIWKNILLDE